MSRLVVPISIVLCLSAWAAGSPLSWAQTQERSGPPPTPVEVTKAVVEAVGWTLSLSGTVVPVRRVKVASELPGVVEKVSVEEGSPASEGDTLVQLSRRTLEIEVEFAQASLEEARAEVARLRAGSRPEEIAEKRAEVKARESLLEGERRNYERLQALYTDGVITLRELEAARFAFETAQAQLEVAQAKLALALAGSRAEDIRAAEARVRSREVALERAEEDVRKASIQAPSEGLVSQKLVEEGEWINTGAPVVELLSIGQVYVVVDVAEKDLFRIQEGQAALITVDAYPDGTFQGQIEAVLPEANRASRTFPVKILVENSQFRLKPGMFARAAVTTETAANAVMVPKESVLDRTGAKVVFIVRDTVAHMVPVETGLSNRSLVQVTRGVEVGDLVVVTGQEGLWDQAPVQVNQVIEPDGSVEPDSQ